MNEWLPKIGDYIRVKVFEENTINLPEEEQYQLITDSQDLKTIKHTIVSKMVLANNFKPIDRDLLRDISDMGCLFVQVIDGELSGAYGMFQSVPHHIYDLTRLL